MNKKRLLLICGYGYMLIVLIASIYQYGNVLSRIYSIYINRADGFWNYNIIPLKTIRNQIARPYLLYQLKRNLLVYIPMGVLISCIHKKPWLCILICSMFILAKESLQFITLTGYFDIDDIIINLSGILLGIILYLPSELLWKLIAKVIAKMNQT